MSPPSAPAARPRPRRLVPLHRQLAVRLSALIAGAMLLFEPTSEALLDAVLALLGELDPHEVARELTNFHNQLLDDALFDEEAGHWVPTEEAVRFVDSIKSRDGSAFVYLDTHSEVVVASDDLPWPPGHRWHEVPGAQGVLDIWGESTHEARYFTVHLEKDDEWAGTLISVLVDEERHAENSGTTVDRMFDDRSCRYGDDPIVLTDVEWATLSQRRAEIERKVRMGVPIVIALAVAALVSRLFTRRLRRLAAMSSVEPTEEGELPGPFDDSGHDEIAGLARALNQSRARVGELLEGLADRDAQRRQWIAQVSHDLRTPLTALTACLERAEHLLGSSDDERLRDDMRELVGVARLDADRVTTLADDLLDIARLDAEQQPEIEPVPPGELVRQAVAAMGPLAQLHGVELVTELDGRLPILHADGRRLMRALENLLRNALQFATQRVVVSARRADDGSDGVRFEVLDDGPGFPARDGHVDLAHLAGRRSRQDSAGLGLLVARKMAEVHGGRLQADNPPGGGGRATIVLPAS